MDESISKTCGLVLEGRDLFRSCSVDKRSGYRKRTRMFQQTGRKSNHYVKPHLKNLSVDNLGGIGCTRLCVNHVE
jgi:hypothetical protein